MVARISTAAAVVLLVGMITPAAAPVEVGLAAPNTSAAMPYDFDGDGYADLAIGVPTEDVGSIKDAGAVQILFGSATGPTARDQLWHQNRKGIRDRAERGDEFGYRLASGDFDADGYADLAVGVPREGLGGRRLSLAGVVQVLYGGPRGLTDRDQVWHQDKSGVPGKNGRGDFFGSALAVGDFEGDGYADLVIEVGGEGRAVILRGSDGGLTGTGAQRWKSSGTVLATGDFNKDGRDDLAVDDLGNTLTVLVGSANGLTTSGAQTFSRTDISSKVIGLGSTVAGDFNADGSDDLVIRLEETSLGGPGGDVAVLYAHSDGFRPKAAELWSLDPARLPGTGFYGDGFGTTMAVGDLTGDGIEDLAIGALGYQPAPAAFVLSGSPSGLQPTKVAISQSDPAVPGAVESFDRFTISMIALPFAGGPTSWLAIGDPKDTVGSIPRAGAVTVFPGSPTGPIAEAGILWNQNSRGVKESAAAGDRFGRLHGFVNP